MEVRVYIRSYKTILHKTLQSVTEEEPVASASSKAVVDAVTPALEETGQPISETSKEEFTAEGPHLQHSTQPQVLVQHA